jgi:lambda family phage tail tape measure protein
MLANRAFQSLMGAGGSGIFASIGKVLGFANGGIVNGPTVFPMANGAGLMGEAGPEAIMPLTRIGGKLGVRAAGGGGSVVNIDARYATEGTAEMIVKAIQRAAPGIVKQSVSANRAAGARGY